MANTAISAETKNTCTITFKNTEHEKFYRKYLQKCRYQDVYHWLRDCGSAVEEKIPQICQPFSETSPYMLG